MISETDSDVDFGIIEMDLHGQASSIYGNMVSLPIHCMAICSGSIGQFSMRNISDMFVQANASEFVKIMDNSDIQIFVGMMLVRVFFI